MFRANLKAIAISNDLGAFALLRKVLLYFAQLSHSTESGHRAYLQLLACHTPG